MAIQDFISAHLPNIQNISLEEFESKLSPNFQKDSTLGTTHVYAKDAKPFAWYDESRRHGFYLPDKPIVVPVSYNFYYICYPQYMPYEQYAYDMGEEYPPYYPDMMGQQMGQYSYRQRGFNVPSNFENPMNSPVNNNPMNGPMKSYMHTMHNPINNTMNGTNPTYDMDEMFKQQMKQNGNNSY